MLAADRVAEQTEIGSRSTGLTSQTQQLWVTSK
jgi:hypothetical protein